MSEKKNISFYILEILKNHSSHKLRLSKNDISAYLRAEYGRESDLRTISSALEALTKLGYPVKYETVFRGGKAHKTSWYIESTLSCEESEALILALRASSLLSKEMSEALIAKLTTPTENISYAEKVTVTPKEIYYQNNTFQSIYVIYSSISDKRMVSFSIIDYIYDEKKQLEESLCRIKEYLIKPIDVVFSGTEICLLGELGDTKNYRYFPIRKLYGIKETNVPFELEDNVKIPLPKNRLECEAMFFGEREKAVILIERCHLGEFFEKLGEQCRIKCFYGEKAEVEVYANFKLLRRFLLSFGSSAEVLSPTKLRRGVALELQTASGKYGEVKRLRGHL